MVERPLIPPLAVDVLVALLSLEGLGDVAEDVLEGRGHLEQAEETSSEDGSYGNQADQCAVGHHLHHRAVGLRVGVPDVREEEVIAQARDVHRHVQYNRQRNEVEPSNQRTEVHEHRHTRAHEPADGEQRRGHFDSEVGVLERVQTPLLVVRDSARHPLPGPVVAGHRVDSGRLVERTLAEDARQPGPEERQLLGDEVRQRAGDAVEVALPRERVVDEEHECHRQHRRQPNRLQRLLGLVGSTDVHVAGDVEQNQCCLEPGHRERVLYQPDPAEDDEIHDSEESREHRCNDADERQLHRIDVRQQPSTGDDVIVTGGEQEDGGEREDEPCRCVGGAGGRRSSDVDLGGRPAQCHAEQVGDVPSGGYGEPDFQADVRGHPREHRSDSDADKHLP